MADQQIVFRTIIEHFNNPGESADNRFDDCVYLSPLQNLTPARRLTLGAADTNIPITFTAAAALFIFSKNGQRFGLRVASGETLIPSLREFLAVSDDISRAVLTTSVLLTGNGINAADLEIWIVEKVTS